jgi:ABC-type amino acid transport substrate-binding protein
MREYGKEFRVINDPTNLLDANQFSIGLKQGDQVFLNYVNWALTRLRVTGRLAAIHRQWLGTENLMPAWARGPI